MTPAERLRAAAEKHRERPMSARRPWGREDKIALAVADWLDVESGNHDFWASLDPATDLSQDPALALADLILGAES